MNLDNLWATELGINLDDLKREHPDHPDQLRNHRRINRAGVKYWERQQFLAANTYRPETIVDTPEVVKSPKKPTKVKDYEFTETQLRIALNAQGAM